MAGYDIDSSNLDYVESDHVNIPDFGLPPDRQDPADFAGGLQPKDSEHSETPGSVFPSRLCSLLLCLLFWATLITLLVLMGAGEM